MKTLKQQLQERINQIPEPASHLVQTGWSRDEGYSSGYYDNNFNEIKDNLSKLPDDIIHIFRKMLEQKRQPYQFGSFQYIAITELLEELKEA